MKKLQRFWRALLFLSLMAALCGSFASPAANGSVIAAPQLQAAGACSTGVLIAEWTFTGQPPFTAYPLAPSIGTGGLLSTTTPAPTFPTSASVNPPAISFSGWPITSPPALDPTKYIEIAASTIGNNDIKLQFDASRSNTGPATFEISYSFDGTNFIPLPPAQTIVPSSTTSMTSYSFDFSTIPQLNDNPNAKFRLFGYAASGTGGTWRLDNIVFCGTPIVTIDNLAPNPTNNGTTVTWHALENGNYELRVGGTSCTDGTIVPGTSGSYTSSPNPISTAIDTASLAEGVNKIFVCLTDNSVPSIIHMASATVTKDTSVPTVTLNQAAGQPDPASALPINFTAEFSEAIDPDTFSPADITYTGGVTGVTWVILPFGDNKTFTVRATALSGSGALTPSIPANAVTDMAGNGSTASTSTDNTVTYTSVIPQGVVISEFRTLGPAGANDEFIELYNPTTAPIDISGWKINVSNDTGSVDTRATIPAATLLRSGQYYLIANNNSSGGYSKSVAPDLTYGTGITNGGGIALLKADNTFVDRVAVGAGSAYKEGTPLSSLTGTSDQSYERKPGGTSDSCQDTNDNSNDFNNISPSKPQNYYSAISLCGTPVTTIPAATTTTITAHNPNPSLVNAGVSVTVKVSVPFSNSIPTGTVNITGANTNCSVTLTSASAGTGSCTVYFSSTGAKSLTATYVGDNLHLKSTSPAVSHQVNTSTSRTATPAYAATPKPPPELVAINEFVPRPGHDWNNDGIVNTGDEYIELLNHGTVNVNLSGWSLDDEVNIGSSPYRLPSVTLRPGERYVFYGRETGLLLGDGGDAVRLLKPNGQLMDAYNYTVVGSPDQSFCRLPDNGGADDWNQYCYATPGLQNSLSADVTAPPVEVDTSLYCPIADTLPDDFAQAECEPFGHEIWNSEYWNRTGWYGNMVLPWIDAKWPVLAN